jgi:molybdopterin-containing oxidoreductase family membrane subunit
MSDQPLETAAARAETAPVITGRHTYGTITDRISSIVLTSGAPRGWWLGFAVSFLLLMILLYSIGYLFARGVGIWGVNNPVGWGFAIVNFVWWVGIGHAGTLISAVLLLLRQHWRTSINRFAEAMTLFAVSCAALFPLLHLGRPHYFYFLVPYPSTTGVWPQFRSPLIWDFFAVGTYATVSLLFWYVGLLPDLAAMRDRAKSRFVQVVYGFFAMGWRGSARHWRRYQQAYLLLGGLATPLVVSVHSVVSLDFAAAAIPGWHTTIFPPYFVAGAIFSGFAMVLTIAIPLRAVFQLRDFVTARHLDNMTKVMLVAGLVVAYGYLMEIFVAWYSGHEFERFVVVNRVLGPYAVWYLLLWTCNIVVPQLLWFRGLRSNPVLLFVIALIVNIGMWLERFIITVVSLHRDFLPSSWGMYTPTVWDWATFVGSIGLFLSLLFLFVRLLPMISIFELQELLTETKDAH